MSWLAKDPPRVLVPFELGKMMARKRASSRADISLAVLKTQLLVP